MTAEERIEHNRAFEEAAGIVRNELPAEGSEDVSPAGWFARRKLARALALFQRVVELNSNNWSAHWMLGRVHLRLQDTASALQAFERAHAANPAQPELARQASRCAMDLGQHQTAVALAQRAVQLDPNSAALRYNLALASLLAGQMPEAQLAVSQAIAGEPTNARTQQLRSMIQHFAAQKDALPPTTAALFEYWRARER